MRRVVNPPLSSPRISRSRGVRVRTRSSTLGSRPAGAAAATSGTGPPAASWRMAVATWRLDRSLARHPSAPAASTAAVVAGWASPARTSSLVVGAAALTAASVSSRSPAGSSASSTNTVGWCLAASSIAWPLWWAKSSTSRSSSEASSIPSPSAISTYCSASKSVTTLVTSGLQAFCEVVGIAALPPGLAEQARRWTRRLSGSLLPHSGMTATPVGRQVAFLDRSGLAIYTKPLLGLDRQVFGRPLVFEGRLWGTLVLGYGPGALYRY